MLNILSRPSLGTAWTIAALVLLSLLGGSALLAEGEIDCGAALSRCLSEQAWWEHLLNPDYCLVGFLFCLYYMQ